MAFGIGRAFKKATVGGLLQTKGPLVKQARDFAKKFLDKRNQPVDDSATKAAEQRALDAEESIRRMKERERRRTVFAGGFSRRKSIFGGGESEFSPTLGGSTIGKDTLG